MKTREPRFLNRNGDVLTMIPEGMFGLRFGEICSCGKADPGIQVETYEYADQRWIGGVLTLHQAEALRDYLVDMIPKVKEYQSF